MSATPNDTPTPQAEVVLPVAARRKIESRLRTRYHAYLRPGERIGLRVEEESDFVFACLKLTSADKRFALELEGAAIVQDQDAAFLAATSPRDRLLAVIEFLADQLNDYFRVQRNQRFHLDWRKHPCSGLIVRFRGTERSPELEQQANRLLGETSEEI
ncbi:hypothetical protein FRC98_08155 [Lujinxingia vulgaris]|uniref:Uncharacterized protein n=1 Tax=Lujinxingia vulgaris TaxID=2600176 RepID=A0A5C6XHL3_9DELT|nr:hypothetical protein [Lujinxingia vulgaris]TXD37652.1 hypothetical protein FRC98_08155 [Lujinxingia vulgaris]